MMREQFLVLVQEPDRAVSRDPGVAAAVVENQAPRSSDTTSANSGEMLPQESTRRPARIETLFGKPTLKSRYPWSALR
jgi:hypothetical protein